MTKNEDAEALHSITIPLAYYEWLAKIEKDVCVHDLTPHEQAGLIAALSPTAKTEPSAAGLDRALWLVNVVEGNVRTSNPNYADQLQEVWSILWDALSAPTREREMRETLSPVREALEQGAKWFEEYADHHAQLAKAAGFNVGKERDAKAERNRERASTLWEAVIAFDLAFKDQASE